MRTVWQCVVGGGNKNASAGKMKLGVAGQNRQPKEAIHSGRFQFITRLLESQALYRFFKHALYVGT